LHNFLDEELVSFSLCISAQYIDELLGQLEIGRLEAHVFAGRPVEDESEVDVDEMALLIDHDIAIMSVLDLQDVADDAVGSETLGEIESCLLELLGRLAAISLQEVLVKVDLVSFAELVATVGVWYALDDSAEESLISRAIADALVGNQIEV